MFLIKDGKTTVSTETAVEIDLRKISQELRIGLPQVESVVRLLDEENTVPFITRYRKDQTGGLDEEQIRLVQSRVAQARALSERKQTILRSIESQGKLTPELAEKIEHAVNPKVLEDLYLPFKPKKQTLATAAREKGLEPLAQEILAGQVLGGDLDQRANDFVDADQKIVPTPADALLGAGHIIAEEFSENAELRGKLRRMIRKTGRLVSQKPEGLDENKGKEFKDYFEFQEPVDKLPPHRILAINRGERAKFLKVRVEADKAAIEEAMQKQLLPEEHPHKDFLQGCAQDALERLIYPSLERELRRELTDRAEEHAVTVFARNLRNLLLQPPVHNRRILAIDPGFRSGCKLAAMDEHGNLLEHDVIFLVGKEERKAEAPGKLVAIIEKHNLNLIAIGNGTACRETEELVAEAIAGPLAGRELAYVVVNEAGASVYSTSNLGREEFPDLDATTRGTMSIGRRLLDPLSELVKIEPQHIGVGLYQHDIKQKHLQQSLDQVVESCVNFVGVDLNTASVALLRYVAGLNQLTARKIVEHRTAHGPFKSREQLKDVQGIGGVSFTQAAGFLQIREGDNPLDHTWIHPENYEAVDKLLGKVEASPEAVANKAGTQQLAEKFKTLEPSALTEELEIGELTLKDILEALVRPGRDPREDLPPPLFKKGILKVEDLQPGMELQGTVLNVVDFGAFVDIGLKESGLVHISEVANRYVRSPHEVVAVGDVVKVWVLSIDQARGRVSLTMIPPGTKREPQESPSGEAGQRQRGKGPRGPKGPGGKEGGPRRKKSGKRGPKESQPSPSAPPEPARPSRTPVPVRGKGRTLERKVPGDNKKKPAEEAPAAEGNEKEKAAPARKSGRSRSSKLPKQSQLTEEMKQGKEPLRSFGDLLQLMSTQNEPEPEPTPPAEAAPPEQGEQAETTQVTETASVPQTETLEQPTAAETTSPEVAEAPAEAETQTVAAESADAQPTEPASPPETAAASTELQPEAVTSEPTPEPPAETVAETPEESAEAAPAAETPQPEATETQAASSAEAETKSGEAAESSESEVAEPEKSPAEN